MDNKTLEYWKPSGLLDYMDENYTSQLAQLLGECTDYVKEMGLDKVDETYLIVVIKRIFSFLILTYDSDKSSEQDYHTTQRLKSNNESRIYALTHLNLHIPTIAETLSDLKSYNKLGQKYFKNLDWEAEVLSIFARNRAFNLWYDAKEKLNTNK